jgi:predicted ATP-dependent serine protease
VDNGIPGGRSGGKTIKKLRLFKTKQHVINIIEVETSEEPRIKTPSEELNRVLEEELF